MRMIFLFILFFCTAEKLFAQNIEFELDSYRGTGCKPGSLTAIPSSDLATYSFLFDQLTAEIPNESIDNDNDEIKVNGRGKKINKNSKNISHKLCAINFFAKIPDGFSVDSIQISYSNRGVTSLDANVEGRFVARLMEFQGLAKSNEKDLHLLEKKIWKNSTSATYEDWTISPVAVIPIKSQCSSKNQRKIRFSFRNHLYVESLTDDINSRGFVTMDSSDMVGSLKFKINTKKCGGILNPIKLQPKKGEVKMSI